MMQLSAHTPLFIGLEPIDFRCGIDKLAITSQNISGLDAKGGAVFVFRNASQTSVKVLVFDGTGFWLMQKRLAQGRLSWWPRTTEQARAISSEELLVVLRGDNPRGMVSPPWRRVRTILDGVHEETGVRHSAQQGRASFARSEANEGRTAP